jgi:hypothetical protein
MNKFLFLYLFIIMRKGTRVKRRTRRNKSRRYRGGTGNQPRNPAGGFNWGAIRNQGTGQGGGINLSGSTSSNNQQVRK